MGEIRRRVITPVLDLLRQGVTPEKIAAAIAIGCVLGIFPVMGSTTLLCTLASVGLGLNLPLIQLVNCIVYPVQLILLIPMLEWGQRLFGAPPLAITLPRVFEMIRSSVWHTVATLGTATARAIVVWTLVSLVAAPAIYFVLVPVLRVLARRRRAAALFVDSLQAPDADRIAQP
ncbi:MAG TPA: DUF2062 domain-containing protein [Bryobacteraceae bacterium]|nr:DUF2062 domain-containing protein [Bryobacteraceae bacterium]